MLAGKFGKKVALCDFVTPSPFGTSWGLGGTCVNVGCIPKKLMHQASLLGESLEDAPFFGWIVPPMEAEDFEHDWQKMVGNIRKHILSLNWGYRGSLQKAHVEYFNALASFVDNHTIQLMGRNEDILGTVTSQYFLIATGGRPRYLEIPGGGAGEFCITSDDIFSLRYHPGKVVIVGASYIALETAGFLSGLGIDVAVIVRSQLLRGFDQQMAEKVGEVLENHGVQLIRDTIPVEIVQLEAGLPGKIMVHLENQVTGEITQEPCNTVILAVGRSPCVATLELDKCGIQQDPESLKILVNERDETSVEHCFAIGDVAEGRPELTPVAIQAGVLLVKRLFSGSEVITDYDKVATTVFTPLEYACTGWSEEKAREVFGDDDIEVYHVTSQPLECSLPGREKTSCYSKIICVKSLKERIVGFHYLGPNAGEVMQGFALALKLNATKADLDGTIGIHPTCAEQFTTLNVAKSSGETWIKTSC